MRNKQFIELMILQAKLEIRFYISHIFIMKFTYVYKNHCNKGNIQIVKYMCSKFKDDKMNVHDNYSGFRQACY